MLVPRYITTMYSIPQENRFVNSIPIAIVLFQSPCMPRPLPYASRRTPRPATRRPLLKKGSIRKLFLWAGNILFWRGEEPGMPEPLIFRCRSMDTVRRPLCGCFVLSCMVGGIFRKPLGFRRCLPPARPEKALPFQAGQSPCTKHPQDCPASPLRTEKSF